MCRERSGRFARYMCASFGFEDFQFRTRFSDVSNTILSNTHTPGDIKPFQVRTTGTRETTEKSSGFLAARFRVVPDHFDSLVVNVMARSDVDVSQMGTVFAQMIERAANSQRPRPRSTIVSLTYWIVWCKTSSLAVPSSDNCWQERCEGTVDERSAVHEWSDYRM